ncbi:MAG: quinone oxidoreductase [Nitriliruptorales bacterium]|nr:quinone oxidoreductase [Nitriliruptorales bacterium]
MQAIVVEELGGPEVLELRDDDDPAVGPGQVAVDVAAAGVNYIDTYHRSGLYEMPLPFTPGLEGAGTIQAVGEGVEGWSVGDHVAWSGSMGSYADRVVANADGIVRIPEGVNPETAAAAMLQGMTAHFLTHDTFPLSSGDRCLVHAGAGGVGLLTIQMAKVRGAEVFTTVGSEEKAALAREAGADHVILYRDVDFVAAVEDLAGPRPLDVVYDGVGAATFEGGLRLLRPRGMMVTFGNASGAVEPIAPLELSRHGSLFLTRPTLFHHIADRESLEHRAEVLFQLIAHDRLAVRIGHRLALADAADAHRMLEARETTGKVLLLP